ncbi:MAG TPA: ATP-binding cassette domain-containing protein [Pyrinomonadaceae bacterium]|nr:ATP-binding cassette domain-containing protein [Pyrinomonadaceae bacterium]
MEELLNIENVSKTFPLNDGKLLQVLSEVNLKILNIPEKPQILSILGPSGGGKTTLLRILAGLDKPDTGKVVIKDGTMREVRIGDIGVVFQRYPLFDDQTVLNNLIEPAKNGGLSAQEAKTKALQSLEEFELSRQANSYPMQLSGGQRQRVAIAQQLIQERRYVILDEPFSGLDPNNIQKVINLLQRTAEKHTDNTFIIVTHDVTSAMIISDHVHLLGKPNDSEKEGAYFVKEYDLIAEGLAYQSNLEDLPRFQEIRKEIKYVHFPRLVITKN